MKEICQNAAQRDGKYEGVRKYMENRETRPNICLVGVLEDKVRENGNRPF